MKEKDKENIKEEKSLKKENKEENKQERKKEETKDNKKQKNDDKDNKNDKNSKKEEVQIKEKLENKTKKKSHKGLIIALSIIILIIIFALSGFATWYFLDKNNQLSSIGRKVEQYEEKLEELKLTGDSKDIEAEISTCKDYISSKDLENAKSSIQKVEELTKKLAQENEAYTNDKLAQVEAIDQSYLTEDDNSKIKVKKEEINKLIKDEQFTTAGIKIDELLVLVNQLTTPNAQLNIVVKQVDVSEFPNIKLYIEATDPSGKVPKNLEQVFFHVDEKDANEQYIKKEILKVAQLDETENLNINMVMDVSGSMEGEPITKVKNVMNSFIDSVQFDTGDLVELTTFSSGVNVNCEFTKDKSMLKNRVNSFSTSGLTSLYDALYLAVNRVAATSGAKCVIAFTDGLDNNSKSSVQDVINQAKKYNIPIFLIGSGIGSNSDLSRIATSTGGFYKNISSITSLKDIYDSIYRQQKELYLVQYKDENSQMHAARNIKLRYRSKEYGGEQTYTFQPTLLASTLAKTSYSNATGAEEAVVKYLQNFPEAITNSDFSKISNYLLTGSNIYNTQKAYVQKNIEEKLLSYEILNVSQQDSNNAIVSTRESYWIARQGKLIEMMTQECKYKVVNSSGGWQLSDFADKVNVISKINYDE